MQPYIPVYKRKDRIAVRIPARARHIGWDDAQQLHKNYYIPLNRKYHKTAWQTADGIVSYMTFITRQCQNSLQWTPSYARLVIFVNSGFNKTAASASVHQLRHQPLSSANKNCRACSASSPPVHRSFVSNYTVYYYQSGRPPPKKSDIHLRPAITGPKHDRQHAFYSLTIIFRF